MHVLQAAGGAAITGSGSRPARRYWPVAVGIGVLGLGLDQAAKALAIAKLDPDHPVTLIDGLLSLWLIRNPGAAFSMGEGFTVGFTVVAIVALVAVAVWGVPRVRHTGWAVAMGFVLAGQHHRPRLCNRRRRLGCSCRRRRRPRDAAGGRGGDNRFFSSDRRAPRGDGQ